MGLMHCGDGVAEKLENQLDYFKLLWNDSLMLKLWKTSSDLTPVKKEILFSCPFLPQEKEQKQKECTAGIRAFFLGTKVGDTESSGWLKSFHVTLPEIECYADFHFAPPSAISVSNTNRKSVDILFGLFSQTFAT